MTWRTGTKLGRTLYRDEALVGMVDTPELAKEIVEAMNAIGQIRIEAESVKGTYQHPDQLEQRVFKAFEAIATLAHRPEPKPEP